MFVISDHKILGVLWHMIQTTTFKHYKHNNNINLKMLIMHNASEMKNHRHQRCKALSHDSDSLVRTKNAYEGAYRGFF